MSIYISWKLEDFKKEKRFKIQPWDCKSGLWWSSMSKGGQVYSRYRPSDAQKILPEWMEHKEVLKVNFPYFKWYRIWYWGDIFPGFMKMKLK